MAVQGYTPNQLMQIVSFPQDGGSSGSNAAAMFIYNAVSLSAGNTGDAIATINGANYFSDGQKRGMTLGSIVFVITDYVGGAGVPLGHFCTVTAVQATSAGYGATTSLAGGTS